MLKTSIVLALGLAFSTGCAAEGVVTAPTPAGLTLSTHTDQRIEGRFVHGDVDVGFTAVMEGDQAATIEVVLAGAALRYHADVSTGAAGFDGGGAALSAAQLTALRALDVELRADLGDAPDRDAIHALLLTGAVSYFAAAPAGYAIGRHGFVSTSASGTSARSLGADGVSCISRGSWYTASWDDNGGNHAQSVQANSNWGQQWNGDFSCMGRCGGGCSGRNWTIDCLEHDVCSKLNYSSSGAVDQNCGDEYLDAADDFSCGFGLWTCCGG